MTKKTPASKAVRRRKTTYPRGWNEKRVGEVIACYDKQTEEEELAEYEAGMQLGGLRVMLVPAELVPDVNRLIRQRREAERELAAGRPARSRSQWQFARVSAATTSAAWDCAALPHTGIMVTCRLGIASSAFRLMCVRR